MPQNRIFERPECRHRSLSASLTDVTKTARQWDAVFAMRVHPELLGKYTAPNVADDDEGYYHRQIQRRRDTLRPHPCLHGFHDHFVLGDRIQPLDPGIVREAFVIAGDDALGIRLAQLFQGKKNAGGRQAANISLACPFADKPPAAQPGQPL